MNDCLVFCRAGDESLHRHWLAPKDQRIYDVFIEYFGDVQWRTYLPHPSDNPGETFIPARMPYARPDQYETFFNVIVPSRLVLEHRLGLTLGNHDVTPSDKVNKEVLQTMRLAHYPIRSMEQLKSKVMVGWINHLSRHDRSPDEAWHWKRIVDAFAAGQIRNGEDLTRLAKAYTSHLLDPQRLAAEIEIRKMPLQLPPDYPPIVLKYTDAITVYADRNIVRNAEKLAKEYSALKRVYVHCGVPFVPDALSYYYLVSRHSGKVLAVQSAEEGAPAVQQTNRGEKGQQWKFVEIGEGYVLIANRLSGLVLDVSGESPEAGQSVIQWPYTGRANQQWFIGMAGAGVYSLINRLSLKYLDVSGQSTAEGAPVIQWHAHGLANQQWCMVLAE